MHEFANTFMPHQQDDDDDGVAWLQSPRPVGRNRAGDWVAPAGKPTEVNW